MLSSVRIEIFLLTSNVKESHLSIMQTEGEKFDSLFLKRAPPFSGGHKALFRMKRKLEFQSPSIA